MHEAAQARHDQLTAELAAIRDRQENGDLREFATSDSPRLIAALEGVLTYAAGLPSPRYPGEVMTLWEEIAADLRDVIGSFVVTAAGKDGKP